MRQHLTAVDAAQTISSAGVDGAAIGSSELTFRPGSIKAGDYSFSIGSAGSTNLVLQTILAPLALAQGPSTVELRGGTHNPFAPPYDFLVRTLFPLVGKMGPEISGTLHCPGYYPAGGGHSLFTIAPCNELQPLELLERGPIVRQSVTATVAALSKSIGNREVLAITDFLDWDRSLGEVVSIERPSGPGNVVTVMIESAQLVEVFTGFGMKRVSAEKVGRRVAEEVRSYLKADVPVGPYLADQLVLWIAIAGSGAFRTVEPTMHTTTHLEIIQVFLEREIQCDQAGRAWEIRVGS